MPKNKPNKGLLKRVRITKSGKIKLPRAAGRHLRSHKSGKRLRGYRAANYASPADSRRVRAMLFIGPQRRKTRPDDAGTAEGSGGSD